MGFGACSSFVKTGLFLCLFGFVFSTIAVFSPSWLVNDQIKFQVGVFYTCTDEGCSNEESSKVHAWQKSIAGVEMTGIILAAISLVFIALLIFGPSTVSGRMWVKTIISMLSVGAALLIVTGAIICATKKEEFPDMFTGFGSSFHLDWSFALALVGGLLYVTTGILFAMDLILS